MIRYPLNFIRLKGLLLVILFLVFLNLQKVTAQKEIFSDQPNQYTRQDTLRGSITKARSWWNLTYYHLEVEVFPRDSTLIGSNTIHYRVKKPHGVMQIDLQQPLEITKVVQNGQKLDFKQEKAVYFIQLPHLPSKGETGKIKIFYEGKPQVSKNPPWSGGVTWARDQKGNPFIATSCQGIGASVWWPCKDHLYDEPDSMRISLTVPKPLTGVSNGRLKKVEEKQTNTTYHWKVSNPINNYAVTFNVGNYIHFEESYEGKKGTLPCKYYVLEGNKKKASKHFDQVYEMLEAFEFWLGPYPFYSDGYKLIETPFVGMEHQSAISYGNGFKNGYGGKDMSRTGYGMKFDFIIVHESAHEWFGNSVTIRDVADLWVHEAFASYAETLYLNYHKGAQAANAYVQGTRSLIKNDFPIIGTYGVSQEGSSDMYFKGANMVHTLRQLFRDDEQFRNTLRGLQEKFYHQTVTSRQVEKYLNQQLKTNLEPFFDQYLRTTQIPVLEYRFLDGNLHYRWTNCLDSFQIPVKIYLNGQPQWLNPKPEWSILKNIPANPSLKVDSNFYIGTMNITGNEMEN